jgi:hypothetical protein
MEHLLCDLDRYINSDPIFGWRTPEDIPIEPVRIEPSIHQVDALGMRSNKLFDFFLGQVRPVPWVIWIADLVQMRLQHGEVWLRKANPQLKNVVRGGQGLV